MQDPFDPDLMTPEERTREIAELLATGYLRHREMRASGAVPGDHADIRARGPESPREPENELDAPGDQSVHASQSDGSAPAAEQEARR